MPDTAREQLGRLVRETWVRWASEQRRPKKSWLVGWDRLSLAQREVDMRIGEAVANQTLATVMGDLPKLRHEHAQLQEKVEDLRQFEREYRARLKAFHLNQVDVLDGKEDAHRG